MSVPSNSVLLEKILTLSESLKEIRDDNSHDHEAIIAHQCETNGRVKRLELFYASLVGGCVALGIVWSVVQSCI